MLNDHHEILIKCKASVKVTSQINEKAKRISKLNCLGKILMQETRKNNIKNHHKTWFENIQNIRPKKVKPVNERVESRILFFKYL